MYIKYVIIVQYEQCLTSKQGLSRVSNRESYTDLCRKSFSMRTIHTRLIYFKPCPYNIYVSGSILYLRLLLYRIRLLSVPKPVIRLVENVNKAELHFCRRRSRQNNKLSSNRGNQQIKLDSVFIYLFFIFLLYILIGM